MEIVSYEAKHRDEESAQTHSPQSLVIFMSHFLLMSKLLRFYGSMDNTLLQCAKIYFGTKSLSLSAGLMCYFSYYWMLSLQSYVESFKNSDAFL